MAEINVKAASKSNDNVNNSKAPVAANKSAATAVLKEAVYKEIVSKIHTYGVVDQLAADYPHIPALTLRSIYTEFRKEVGLHRFYRFQRTDNADALYRKDDCKILTLSGLLAVSSMNEIEILNRVRSMLAKKKEDTVLLRCAQSNQLDPCLFAKIILWRLLQDQTPDKEISFQDARGFVNRALSHQHEIQDEQMREEIAHCIEADDNFSPWMNKIQRMLGDEYEILLKGKLKELNIPFIGEKEMVDEGYPKTPDVKLLIPIAVQGYVVNWIESKALFCHRQLHEKHLNNQLWSYHNRFGPGIVIYWFGFVEEIDVNRDKGIMVLNDFPKEITTIVPELDGLS